MEPIDYINYRRSRHRYNENMLAKIRQKNEDALRCGAITQEKYDVLMKDWPIKEELNRIYGKGIDLLERCMLGIATEEEHALLAKLEERLQSVPKLRTTGFLDGPLIGLNPLEQSTREPSRKDIEHSFAFYRGRKEPEPFVLTEDNGEELRGCTIYDVLCSGEAETGGFCVIFLKRPKQK